MHITTTQPLTLDEFLKLPETEPASEYINDAIYQNANLEQRSVLENTAKLAVVALLLDLSGLFLPPFCATTEDSVEIEAADESTVVRGRIAPYDSGNSPNCSRYRVSNASASANFCSACFTAVVPVPATAPSQQR